MSDFSETRLFPISTNEDCKLLVWVQSLVSCNQFFFLIHFSICYDYLVGIYAVSFVTLLVAGNVRIIFLSIYR